MKCLATFIICLMVFIFSGCGDSSTVNTVSDFSGEWIGVPRYSNSSEPNHVCYLNLKHSGSVVSGDIHLIHSNSIQTTIIGNVSGNQINISLTDQSTGHVINFTLSSSQSKADSALSGTWTNVTTGVTYNIDFNKISDMVAQSEFNQKDPNINEYFLQKQGGTGSPVIFIHGMTGSAKNWTKWETYLQNNGFYNKHEVWIYQYDWTKHIQDNGTDLLNRIKALNFSTPPILVGHSMGGLVSRAYISQGGSFTKLVTLGTPHLGSPLANKAILYMASFNQPGPQDLSPDSDFIKSINVNQTDINSRNKYYTWSAKIQGHWSGVIWKWDGNYNSILELGWAIMKADNQGDNDGLVQVTSALLEGTNKQPDTQIMDHFQYLDPNCSQEISNFIFNL